MPPYVLATGGMDMVPTCREFSRWGHACHFGLHHCSSSVYQSERVRTTYCIKLTARAYEGIDLFDCAIVARINHE